MQKAVMADTSVIADGRITELVRKGELKERKILIHQAVLGELEHQANVGRETGLAGLSEVRALQELSKKKHIQFEIVGKRASSEQIAGAKSHGYVDALIRDSAKEEGATLITSDKVQAEVALAEGLDVIYLEPQPEPEKGLPFLKYFTSKTMSIHLKEGTLPLAKVGEPGKVELKKLSEKRIERKELLEMAKAIIEEARKSPRNSYIEIDRKGATVVQIREYRIAIARPPFSDGVEITVVRPIAKVPLEDYALSKELKERLAGEAEGIVICGPPGSGKSTFTTALAEFYMRQDKIVKTMESPRDLQVVDEITQYSPLEGSFEKTSDILLLVRPDYSVYDEMRKTEDFRIYSDMRMAGVGMIGVVHASKPIDAVQRFIGRIDLGIIPQIVDTMVFIKGGKVQKVLELSFLVKVPSGMMEADLARPVIEVRDFATKELEYEIYKFGEETVVLPLQQRVAGGHGRGGRSSRAASEEEVEQVLRSHISGQYELEMHGNRAIVYVMRRDIPRLLGRRGKKIESLQRKLGIKIDVRELE